MTEHTDQQKFDGIFPDHKRSTIMRKFEILNHIYINKYKAVIVVEVMSS